MPAIDRVIAYKLGGCGVMATVLLAACVSGSRIHTVQTGSGLGMEQLLRLPATRGHAGVDEVVDALQRLYGVDKAIPLSPRINTSATITLADGAKISQVFVSGGPTDWESINLGVNLDRAAATCLTVERAASLIGAIKTDQSVGDGIGQNGRVRYAFNSREVRIDLVAPHPGPHCLGAVWIYKKPQQPQH